MSIFLQKIPIKIPQSKIYNGNQNFLYKINTQPKEMVQKISCFKKNLKQPFLESKYHYFSLNPI